MKISRFPLYLGFALLCAGLFLAFGAPQMADASLLPAIGIGMTTLAANQPRAYEQGNRNEIPMIASDIIYEGAAVGIVAASGLARPLVAGDAFAGFAEAKADNSSGAAAAKNVRVISNDLIELPIAGLAITNIGAAVYASDDNTFTLVSTSNTKIGKVRRFISSGVGLVAFEAFTS
jgi:hypothetical protein